MPSTTSWSAKLACVLSLPALALGNRFCSFGGGPGCSAPFWPGHKHMGAAWWAVGVKGTYIMDLNTNLHVPDAPENLNGVMAINTAMENSDIQDVTDQHVEGITYQSMTAAYPPGWDTGTCKQKSKEWCSFASFFDAAKPVDRQQWLVNPSAKTQGAINLFWSYMLAPADVADDPNNALTPAIGVVGADHVSLSNPAPNPIWQFWPKTECGCSSSGMIPAHTYTNTTVTLNEPAPNWGDSVSHNDASSTKPYTTDGGKTWTIDTIDIEATWCENAEPCLPADQKEMNPTLLPWTTITATSTSTTTGMFTFTTGGVAFVTEAPKRRA